MGNEPTPINQFIEYRLDELKSMVLEVLAKQDDHLANFNNHIREDAIMAEQIRALMEEKRSDAGLWAGLAGVGTAVGSFIYSMFGK